MRIKLDFNSPEAIYIQLRNQIVMQIAQEQLHEGVQYPVVGGSREKGLHFPGGQGADFQQQPVCAVGKTVPRHHRVAQKAPA